MARRKRKPKPQAPDPQAPAASPARVPQLGTGLGPLLKAALAASPGRRKGNGDGNGDKSPKPGHSVPVTQPPPGPVPPERVPATDPPGRPSPFEPDREEPPPPRSATELRWLNDAYDGVTPLSKASRLRQRRASDGSAGAFGAHTGTAGIDHESADARARARLQALVGEGTRFVTDTREGGWVEARREGVGRQELRRLRGPGFHAEATLDLHGARTAEVGPRLSRFIRAQRTRGCRYLLIVHGKGLHSSDGRGVLGDAVFEALTRGGAAPLVRALCTPHDQHGGSGAIAVAID